MLYIAVTKIGARSEIDEYNTFYNVYTCETVQEAKRLALQDYGKTRVLDIREWAEGESAYELYLAILKELQ